MSAVNTIATVVDEIFEIAKNAMQVDEDSKLNLEPEVESTHGDAGYNSDTPPTAEDWKTMKGYGSFISELRRLLALLFNI
jgi:hypothetical protein